MLLSVTSEMGDKNRVTLHTSRVSPGISHPVITTEAELPLQGAEGGTGLRHPAPPHVRQTHVCPGETGALQHLTHVVIVPREEGVMLRPSDWSIQPSDWLVASNDLLTCCLTRTRGCSEGGSGEDTPPRDLTLAAAARRPLLVSLVSGLRGRMCWTSSLIEFIRLKSLQSSAKVKLQLRVFEWGLWPLNHLEVTLTRLKLWSSQHMTFVLNLAQSRSFLLLALASWK